MYMEARIRRAESLPPEDEGIPLRQTAERTLYSQECLSLLVRKGRLEAVKRGRIWYTTRRALESYVRSLTRR